MLEGASNKKKFHERGIVWIFPVYFTCLWTCVQMQATLSQSKPLNKNKQIPASLDLWNGTIWIFLDKYETILGKFQENWQFKPIRFKDFLQLSDNLNIPETHVLSGSKDLTWCLLRSRSVLFCPIHHYSEQQRSPSLPQRPKLDTHTHIKYSALEGPCPCLNDQWL